MKRTIIATMVMSLLAAVGFSGCETTGQGARLGAGLGALAGGIIGNQSGRALEGAAIGALIGAATGAVVSDIRQKRLANRVELEREYRDAGRAVPSGQTVSLEELYATPARVDYETPVNCEGSYDVFGAADPTQRYGEVQIYHAETNAFLLEPARFDIDGEGRHVFDTAIDVPSDAAKGEYVVQVRIVNGSAEKAESRRFSVV